MNRAPSPLTPAQAKMLRSAIIHPDGTVLASGFNRGPNHSATAKALRARGLIEWVKQSGGWEVWKITPAGREAAR